MTGKKGIGGGGGGMVVVVGWGRSGGGSYVDGAARNPLLAQVVTKICLDSMNLSGGEGQGGKSVGTVPPL
jgi:hypothetical protein